MNDWPEISDADVAEGLKDSTPIERDGTGRIINRPRPARTMQARRGPGRSEAETQRSARNSLRPLSGEAQGNEFSFVSIADLGPSVEPDWVWPGYLARGAITLFTGLWKSGKTTLLSHLLRDLYRGEGLVDLAIEGPTLIVSEEPASLWTQRREQLGLPASIMLLRRQTFLRPDIGGWHRLLSEIIKVVEETGAELVVFDTLPSAWPVLNENDAGESLQALVPLRGVSEAGAAVLLCHHPRKNDGAEGRATRGSGALPGFVDVLVELRRNAPADPADRRRVLSALSRYDSTPATTVIELAEEGYKVLGERVEVGRSDDMDTIVGLLTDGAPGLTWEEVRDAWPGLPQPGQTRLRALLNAGFEGGRWNRTGTGKKGNPWRYAAPETAPDSFHCAPTPRGHETNGLTSTAQRASKAIGPDPSDPMASAPSVLSEATANARTGSG